MFSVYNGMTNETFYVQKVTQTYENKWKDKTIVKYILPLEFPLAVSAMIFVDITTPDWLKNVFLKQCVWI